jgi:acetolactate synthase-1/2/3 large subunit
MGITLPIVKHSYIIRDVRDLEHTIREAFQIASSGRKGPVLIDIPKSIQADTCEYTGVRLTDGNRGKKEPKNSFKEAVEAIKNSKKPYIYCGGGVISSGAEKEVLELSKRLSAPIGLSIMGLTAIPNSYELNLGMCGMHGHYAASKAQSEADLIIALGVRFSDRATGNVKEYTKNCTVLHVDIDDAEIGKNVHSDIWLCGDLKPILSTILDEIPTFRNEGWLKQIEEFKETVKIEKNEKFTPKNIIELVNSFCDKDTVIATDVGQHQMWTAQYYKFEKPRTFLTSGGLGTMGFGMGAAIGGCIARGKKKTVLFTSDGSFGMNLTELATAVSQELPLLIILLNNGTLGMVRQWQQAFYENRYSQTTLDRKTDFPMLARAFGANGHRAESLMELKKLLEEIGDISSPHLIECKINIDEKVLPMIPPGGSVKDIILN